MKKLLFLLTILPFALSAVSFDTARLLEAQDKAKSVFENNKSAFGAAEILEANGIKKLFADHEYNLTNEQYVNLLYDYSTYLTYMIGRPLKEDIKWQKRYAGHVEEDIEKFLVPANNRAFIVENVTFYQTVNGEDLYTYNDGLNLEQAIKLLEKAKKLSPKDTRLYKALGQNYYKLYWLGLNAGNLMEGGDFYPKIGIDYENIAPEIKKYYMLYVKLCKEQNIKPELNSIEQTIVDRNGMFIEQYSTFKHYEDKGYGNKGYFRFRKDSRTFDDKIKNVCSDYVAMLNRLPDNNKSRCMSRYASFSIAPFEYVTELDNKTIKELCRCNRYEGCCYANIEQYKKYAMHNKLIKYKGEYFETTTDFLFWMQDNSANAKYICTYQYIDFTLKEQNLSHNSYEYCEDIIDPDTNTLKQGVNNGNDK